MVVATRERVGKATFFKRLIGAGLLMVWLGASVSGCAPSLANTWAQNSPVLKPNSMQTEVRLGMRP